jgi:predicted transcriptional regulator
MEMELSKEVQKRLDKINWDHLKEKHGISKETIMKNPAVATQLAYGQMTDLVYGSTKELTGLFSLRAYPQGEGQEWAVKLFTMEKAKTPNDTLYLYNQPITSQKVKEALIERTSWEDNSGNPRKGLANANGGRHITIEVDGRRQEFLVSIHQPTNRVVGMPVEQVRAMLLDDKGHSRGKGIYGVTFTDEQAKALAEGKAIAISGMKRDGERFTCCVQFDAAQRQVVTCHPTWFKEAQKAGLDMKYSKELKVDPQVKQQVENSMKEGQKKGRKQSVKVG